MRAGDLVAIEVDANAKDENRKTTIDGVLYRVLERRLIVSVDEQLPDELIDRIVRL